jgi:hypothetical protein
VAAEKPYTLVRDWIRLTKALSAEAWDGAMVICPLDRDNLPSTLGTINIANSLFSRELRKPRFLPHFPLLQYCSLGQYI